MMFRSISAMPRLCVGCTDLCIRVQAYICVRVDERQRNGGMAEAMFMLSEPRLTTVDHSIYRVLEVTAVLSHLLIIRVASILVQHAFELKTSVGFLLIYIYYFSLCLKSFLFPALVS